MEFIDTHTHLYDEAYGDGCAEAVDRAVEAGVDRMILPDIDGKTRQAMFDLAAAREGTLHPCIGLHPTSVGTDWETECGKLEAEKHRKGIVAVGETGLDFHWSDEFMSEQKEAFRLQVELAA